MSSDLQIVPLSRSGGDVSRFLRVSYDIYRNDPQWVAPLLMDLKKVFTDANPLFDHARMQLWVAVRNGRDVGRIAGIVDENHNRVQKEKVAFFGFFECVEDREVCHRLFNEAAAWTRQNGLNRMIGPMNPTSNDECGLLVKGFDSPPMIMMTYNPPYYIDLIEGEGFSKTKDLLAFHIDLAKTPMDRFERIAGRVKERWPELKLSPIRRKTLQSDLTKIKEVYNAAWEDNWGFTPMTDPEVDFMADRLKPLLTEGITWLAEAGGEPVGFLLAMPDYNTVFQPLRGHLLTPALIPALPYLLQWKYPTRVRVITLGVKKEFRGRGLESVMLFEGLKAGFKIGFREAEASWILEDNTMMCRMLEVFGAIPYKTYRIYGRDLPPARA